MTVKIAENRRDPRYNLKPECAFAEFDDPWDPDRRWSGHLLGLSPAGVSLEVETVMRLQPETALPDAVLQVGECVLEGSIVVKNVAEVDGSRSSIGGLFYPRTDVDAVKLMALIAGMEAIETIWQPAPPAESEFGETADERGTAVD